MEAVSAVFAKAKLLQCRFPSFPGLTHVLAEAFLSELAAILDAFRHAVEPGRSAILGLACKRMRIEQGDACAFAPAQSFARRHARLVIVGEMERPAGIAGDNAVAAERLQSTLVHDDVVVAIPRPHAAMQLGRVSKAVLLRDLPDRAIRRSHLRHGAI